MADEDPEHPAPDGLAEAGRRLWTSIAGPFGLDEHELATLLAACRTADLLDRLALELAAAPALVVEGKKSDQVAHPAAVEHRQQSLALSRLIAALRVPTGEDEERPQRRGGARQPYSRRAELRAVRGHG